jgi:hypothetical protein
MARRTQADRDRGYSDDGSGRRDSGIEPSGDYSAQMSDYDRVSSQIPIWNWLDGSSARAAEAQARAEEQRNRDIWGGLADWAPSADDLAVEYEQEGDVAGPGRSELGDARADQTSLRAQHAALRQMQDWSRGDLTAADLAQRDAMQRGQAQMARGQREALMQQAQARGMGGSGMALLSAQQADESATARSADYDAQLQAMAQQRALQALQGAGSLSSQMRGQSFGEDSTRRSAIDDFNRWQTDYQRGREQRNTGWRNQTRDSRSGARQQAYENRERAAAGMTNQYGTDVARRQGEAARRDQQGASLATTAAGIIEGFTS